MTPSSSSNAPNVASTASETIPGGKGTPPGPKALKRALWPIRLILALAFLAAAWPKLLAPRDLADVMTGYRILPLALIAPASVLLPAFELLSALAVLLGPRPYRRAGALILGLLLAVFMLAAAQGLARGLDFECGCFGAGDGRKPGLLFFLEDGILFLMAAFIFFKDVNTPPDNLNKPKIIALAD